GACAATCERQRVRSSTCWLGFSRVPAGVRPWNFVDRDFVRYHSDAILSGQMHSVATSTLAWVGFCSFILVMLAIDLGVFNRKPHEISYRNAAIWSAVWVTLALVFAGLLFGPLGWELFGDARSHKALEFLTGYLI